MRWRQCLAIGLVLTALCVSPGAQANPESMPTMPPADMDAERQMDVAGSYNESDRHREIALAVLERLIRAHSNDEVGARARLKLACIFRESDSSRALALWEDVKRLFALSQYAVLADYRLATMKWERQRDFDSFLSVIDGLISQSGGIPLRTAGRRRIEPVAWLSRNNQERLLGELYDGAATTLKDCGRVAEALDVLRLMREQLGRDHPVRDWGVYECGQSTTQEVDSLLFEQNGPQLCGRWQDDRHPPRIIALLPRNNDHIEVGAARIDFLLHDGCSMESQVDLSATRVFLDGRDITIETQRRVSFDVTALTGPDSVFEAIRVTWHPDSPLVCGPREVLVKTRDHHGNVAAAAWRFTVTRIVALQMSIDYDLPEPPEAVQYPGEKAFYAAVKRGDLGAVSGALATHPDFAFIVDHMGQSPLHVAARCGHVDVARLLIERGTAAMGQDVNFATPLHHAVENGHAGVVGLLLQYGARDQAAKPGDTAVWLAVEKGQTAIVRMLLRTGADRNFRQLDSGPNTSWPYSRRGLVHLAADVGSGSIIELLLAAGTSVDDRDGEGLTALHHAAWKRQYDAALVLLRHGAQINARDRHGRTPLQVMWAAVGEFGNAKDFDRVLQLLRRWGGRE